MSGARVAIVVGILALGGTTAYLFLGGDKSTGSQETPAAAREGSAVAPAAPTGKAAISAPAGPALATGSAAAPAVVEAPSEPAPTTAPPPPTASASAATPESFAAQQRDPAWAGKTENELRNRIPKLGTAQLEAAECRHDQCQLTLGGSQDDVAAILARLESPTKGITNFAKSVMLTAPEQQGDKLVIRAYAQFER